MAIDAFRDWLDAYREAQTIPSLSVGVIADGDPALLDGFGSPDVDEDLPTTADTTYPAGSLTTPLAATTVLGMVEDGHLALDDDVTDLSYWDGFVAALADANSVFGGGETDDGTVVDPVDPDATITVGDVLAHRVNGTPGEAFLYNPVVFGRLADYVAERTGTPYREWLERYVLDPAGMADTTAGWRDESRGATLSRLATPARHDEDGRPESAPMPEATLSASAGLLTTVRDLAAFDLALDAGLLVDPETRERLWTPPDSAAGPDGGTGDESGRGTDDDSDDVGPYGLGWYVQRYAGDRLVWHAGWWPDAYAGFYLKAPDTGYTLIVLSSTDALWWDNPLDDARIEDCPVARQFLDRVV